MMYKSSFFAKGWAYFYFYGLRGRQGARALAKRGGKLEDSPSLLRTRVLGLLLLCLLRRYSLLMLWTAFLCVVILQFNQ